jgi:glucokinase
MAAVAAPVLALDVGGTKLAAALVAPDGSLLARAQAPTGATDADQLLRRCVDLLGSVRSDADVVGVGVGCGGPMRWPSGEVSPLNISAWREFPLRAALADALDLPVRLHNDAVAMTLGEHWRGAAAGFADALGVVVSTGVGGGVVLADRVVDGASGNAGHVGHIVVEPEGPPCACGGRGCLEAVASGPAMVGLALAAGWPGPPAADAVALATAARSGDPVAVATFDRAGRALGRGLASAVAVLDVSVVVVGGGVSAAADLFEAAMRTEFRGRAGLDFAAAGGIRWAALGGDAGLVGAAALWLRPGVWTGGGTG